MKIENTGKVTQKMKQKGRVKYVKPGQTIDLTDDVAKQLIDRGTTWGAVTEAPKKKKGAE
jgi:hypothetical protein